MTRPLQETASLHEKAVQAIARGDVPPQVRKARRSPLRAVNPVNHLKVDRAALTIAQWIIADPTNGYTRWEAVSSTEIIVR